MEKNEIGGACSTYGGEQRCKRVLVGKPEGKRPVGRPRRRWEDNVKIDLQEVGWGHGMVRFGSGQGQVAGTCQCGNKPSGLIKYGGFD